MRGGSEPQDNVSSLGWGSSLRSSQILVDGRNVWISCLVAHLLQLRQTGTSLSRWTTNNLLGLGKSPAGFLCPTAAECSWEGVCQHPLLGGDLGKTSVFCEPVCPGETWVRMRGKQWHQCPWWTAASL